MGHHVMGVKKCDECKKPHKAPRYLIKKGRAKYCSMECCRVFRARELKKLKKKHSKKCEWCHKVFYWRSSMKRKFAKQRYDSKKCYQEHAKSKRIVRTCINPDCKAPFKIRGSEFKRRQRLYCSHQCYAKTRSGTVVHGLRRRHGSKFIWDRYSVISGQLRRIHKKMSIKHLPKDFMLAFMMCELAKFKIGGARRMRTAEGQKLALEYRRTGNLPTSFR